MVDNFLFLGQNGLNQRKEKNVFLSMSMKMDKLLRFEHFNKLRLTLSYFNLETVLYLKGNFLNLKLTTKKIHSG